MPGARQTASVAKAYVSRAAREVAHGSMQVFGGIAFTEEHPAHRFLRRIIVREQQFGDAAHHERELGRSLAAGATHGTGGGVTATDELGFNDPTAQRLERITTGADPEIVGPMLADILHDPRWLGVRRRADLGRQVQPDLPGGLRCGRGHPAAPAARPHPSHRARHGPRIPRHDRAGGHGGAGSADLSPRRRRQPAGRAVLRHGARRRPHLPQRASARIRGDPG